jgi:hypothetical protein
MQWLALILVMLAVALGAACGDRGGTSLEGSIECSDTTCSSGQLCSTCDVSPDGSVPPAGWCHDVPSGCDVVDCTYGECPHCLDLCGGGEPGGVKGRTLSCGCLQ